MKALIVGFGVSGIGAKNFLESQNIICEIAKAEDINSGENLNDKKYLDRLFDGLSFIVTSPGISSDIRLLKLARLRKIKIIGELELAALNIKGDIIAITGTNGKTTTVSIIKHLLQNLDKNVFLAGNIGTAATSICTKTQKDSISILECSSFQLENVTKFHVHIAAILNISEDHLNRHKTMKNYIKAKQNISKNQTQKDFLLINADDKLLMQNIPKTKAKIFYFSTKKQVCGCYVKNNCIYFNDGINENKLLSLKYVKLVGEHNISNILCAILAVYLQTGHLFLLKNISSFYGVAHRIEFIRTISGVSFYNDSKATNIDSTLVALKSFKSNIHLILGGSDKGYSFDKLFEMLPKNVVQIIACGQTAQKIMDSAKKYEFYNIKIANNLKVAVDICKIDAKNGEVVLLSPACASFDQFKNFEERGNIFKKIVEEIVVCENVCAKNNQTT